LNLKVEEWPVKRLVPYARNPRKNDEQVDRMAGAIREFGFRIPVVAKSDGTIVDGHLRLKAAMKLGMETVPVALADELTEAQVKAFRILANKSANWAEWDVELLALELDELCELGVDMEQWGFEVPNAEVLFDPLPPTAPEGGAGEELTCPKCGCRFEVAK
jgi:ParB-like chromosome segregation protein Spo0J